MKLTIKVLGSGQFQLDIIDPNSEIKSKAKNNSNTTPNFAEIGKSAAKKKNKLDKVKKEEKGIQVSIDELEERRTMMQPFYDFVRKEIKSIEIKL